MLITDGSLRPPSHQPRGQFVGHNRKTCSPTGCRDLWLLGKMLSVTSWWVIVEKEVCSTGLKIFVWSLWLWAGCCGHQRQQFVCKQPNYSPSVRETVKNVMQSQNGDCSPCCSFWKLLLTQLLFLFFSNPVCPAALTSRTMVWVHRCTKHIWGEEIYELYRLLLFTCFLFIFNYFIYVECKNAELSGIRKEKRKEKE